MKMTFQYPGWTTRNSDENVAFIVDDAPVPLYLLRDHGIEIAIINYGARIVSIRTTNRYGNIANIVLDYSGLDGNISDISSYLGVVVERHATTEVIGLFTDVVNVMPFDSVALDLCSG